MGALNPVFSAASITMGAYQSRQSAEAAKFEAELAADNLEAQALRKELEADEALKIGELNMAEHLAKGRKDIAKTTVSYAASGVKVNDGSAVEVAADKAAWSEYERQKIEYEANLESWGLKYDAALLNQEANNARASGSSGGSGLQAVLGAGTKLTAMFK